ncbi:MAG: hypothetical protein Q9160_003322 [Pyrenula sp. 1 TL-2023]
MLDLSFLLLSTFTIFLTQSVRSDLSPNETSGALATHRSNQTLSRRTHIAGEPECSPEQRGFLNLDLAEISRWTSAASRTVRWQTEDASLNVARTTTFRDSFGMHVRNRESKQVQWRFVGVLMEASQDARFVDFRESEGIDPQGRVTLRCGREGRLGCVGPQMSVVFAHADQVVLCPPFFNLMIIPRPDNRLSQTGHLLGRLLMCDSVAALSAFSLGHRRLTFSDEGGKAYNVSRYEHFATSDIFLAALYLNGLTDGDSDE